MQESDVDRYIRESSKSYKNCRIKNSARRNSLQKKTMGIESERKLAKSELGREEKQLREQFRQMQIDKMKNSLIQNMRDQSSQRSLREDSEENSDEDLSLSTETYRITPLLYSPCTSPSQRHKKISLQEQGRQYASRRGRRQSREFEDLNVDTKTGSLLQPFNVAKRLLSSQNSMTSSLTRLSSARSDRRSTSSLCSPRRRQNSSGESSSSAISSLEDLHWIGDPEATKSVRRNRKTSEEQHFDHELKKINREKLKAINQ